MNNAAWTKQIIEEQRRELNQYGVARVGIFGSQGRGDASDKSDIDLILDFIPHKKTYRNFMNATLLLEEKFKRRVDAITPQSLSPYIKPYIEKDISYVQITA